MDNHEEYIKTRNQLIAKLSLTKIKMVELVGKDAYENFRSKIRLVNKLNLIIDDLKTMGHENSIPNNLVIDVDALELGIFGEDKKPKKVSELITILITELEEVKININNYLDVNPEFAKLHNEMIVLLVSERKLKIDANSYYGRTTANPNLQPTFSKEAHEVLKQSTGKDQ